ncbi:PLP-dependent aminotransferase family protein [Pelagicoccus sp. SDUM812005]|uniref:aminotransferase-like domain-containing protein n=1 Tax=Pelagicoccus sp. SDUM812005 TaxID=3041257 RepID=UPI00280F002E|nr:PLP-dependent aminotransferase family protein [Pelagicoccus sp. SDUM812005]MDQ8179992.1 PLP-dependent aminotransferase family protein [Pelagicoccus sp. SDUM812005]
MKTPSQSTPRLAQRIQKLTGSVARDILSRTQDKEIISFAGGLPDASLWQNLKLPDVPPAAYQYGPSEGERSLRSILAARSQSLGLDATADSTLITSGSQQGLDLAAKLILEPGTPIILEAPSYLAAIQVFKLFQAELHSLELDSEGICPQALDRLLAETQAPVIYLNPTFQNPSGACYSLERRKQIAAVLDQHDTILLEDDPYRDIAYDTPPAPPIASFLKRCPWIYLASVSKTLIPGLRLGSLTCSPELFPHLLKLKQAADLHSNRPAQFVAAQMLQDPQANAERLAGLCQHYREKRDLMQRYLSQHFSDLATWEIPSGGMFFWLTFKLSIDLSAALAQTLERGVAFMPGTPFFSEAEQAGCSMRVNFSLVSPERMEAGIRILAEVVRDLHQPAACAKSSA